MANDFKYVIRYSNVLNIRMFEAGKISFKNIFCIKDLMLTKAFFFFQNDRKNSNIVKFFFFQNDRKNSNIVKYCYSFKIAVLSFNQSILKCSLFL